MPSARMAPDGALSLSADFFQNNQRYSLGFQIFPWLEGSFRYAGLRHYSADYPVYYDRSFAVKARLWDESSVMPALAIGVNDLVGTGVYGSEYLAASKRFGAIDATVGMGWGRLGNANTFKNPLGTLSKSFYTRGTSTTQGGTFNFKQYFHGGSVGLFGGVSWHTPVTGLTLSVEYSSDTYNDERANGNFAPRSQVNYSASYALTQSISLGVDWLYGRTIGGHVAFQLDPARPQYPTKLGPPPPQVAIRTPEEQKLALQVMLPSNRGGRSSSQQANARRTSFVDTLWHLDGLEYVDLKGQVLILRAAKDASRHCIAAAQLAEVYDGSIKRVIVNSGGTAVQCVTDAATAPTYHNIALADLEPAIMSPASLSVDAVVINAVRPDEKKIVAAIRSEARRQQISIEAVALTDSVALVYYSNGHYLSEADALDRLTRILMKEAPPETERFRFIAVANGVPQQEFDILRGPEERKFAQAERLDLFGDVTAATISAPPLQNPVLVQASRATYPRFSWDIYPQLRQELFDPDNPFAIELTAVADGSFAIRPGLTLNGEVETSLFDNFSLARQSNSTLPHVRSDFLKFFAQGKTGIGQLDAEYRFRLTPNIFATVKAGYLESMFAGVGSEVLWRPEGQRWALGVDAYEVWQRGFDRLFDFRSYRAFTGHVSLYYAMPWYELNLALRAGQYLAGDRGLTVEITRRFSTGVEIGAFATKTNISAAQFGEGSFDKGLIIRIPLGWSLPIETQSQFNVDLRPIQRDGGQRLANDATLYEETRRTSLAEIQNQLY